MPTARRTDLFKSLRIALVFLTTLPVRYPASTTPRDKRLSVFCYPLAGLCIGMLLLAAAWLLPAGTAVSAGLVLGLWVVLTGALHLDGLGDCADAWVGGLGDRQRTLAIMKDPAAGIMAVVVLVLTLGLKLLAVAELMAGGQLAFLVVLPVVARVTPMLLFATTRYVRGDGIGAGLGAAADDRKLVWYVAAGVGVFVLLVSGAGGLWVLLASGVLFWAIRHCSVRRLGGFTGDVAGACIEIVELGGCLVLVLTRFA